MRIAFIPMCLMVSVVPGEESYKAPRYEVFSILLLLTVSYAQVLFLAPSPRHSVCFIPLGKRPNFKTHT